MFCIVYHPILSQSIAALKNSVPSGFGALGFPVHGGVNSLLVTAASEVIRSA